MAFTGNEDHSISLKDAAKLTKKYRDAAGAAAILGGYFGKTAVQSLLDQTDCVGIKFYYGQEENGTMQLVILGVTSAEKDLTDGEIAERSVPCPPYCGSHNSLNS